MFNPLIYRFPQFHLLFVCVLFSLSLAIKFYAILSPVQTYVSTTTVKILNNCSYFPSLSYGHTVSCSPLPPPVSNLWQLLICLSRFPQGHDRIRLNLNAWGTEGKGRQGGRKQGGGRKKERKEECQIQGQTSWPNDLENHFLFPHKFLVNYKLAAASRQAACPGAGRG